MTAPWKLAAVSMLFVGSVVAIAEEQATKPASEEKTVTTASGLTIIEKGVDPSTAVAKAGDQVWVHYTGTLKSNGTKFDSSRDRGEPIDFVLGTGRVIKGWDEGIAGMSVGQKRQLIIPANLGYGDRGQGNAIPGGATLVFEVELVGLKKG